MLGLLRLVCLDVEVVVMDVVSSLSDSWDTPSLKSASLVDGLVAKSRTEVSASEPGEVE